MVTMTLLQGVLNTFVIFLSRMIATAVATSRNDNGSEERSSGIYFLVSMVLEILFGVLATIIAMWFSRCSPSGNCSTPILYARIAFLLISSEERIYSFSKRLP